MKCHTNDNSTSSTQLPHKFSYIVDILGHNHFESPNMYNNRNEYDRRAKHIWRKNYEMGSEMCKDKQKIISREN
jgi:hypothetical protein